MRLFAALLPPPAVLAELEAVVAGLRERPEADRLRWTLPDGWHVTLAFLGEVDDALLPELEERLGRAARRHPVLRLRLAGGGHFGGRALWIEVTGERDALRRLAASAAAGARRAGVAVEDRRAFRPHLTVARGRGGAQMGPYAADLAGFTGSEWRAEELALVRSRLPSRGTPGERPRYETVAAWPLGR